MIASNQEEGPLPARHVADATTTNREHRASHHKRIIIIALDYYLLVHTVKLLDTCPSGGDQCLLIFEATSKQIIESCLTTARRYDDQSWTVQSQSVL